MQTHNNNAQSVGRRSLFGRTPYPLATYAVAYFPSPHLGRELIFERPLSQRPCFEFVNRDSVTARLQYAMICIRSPSLCTEKIS